MQMSSLVILIPYNQLNKFKQTYKVAFQNQSASDFLIHASAYRLYCQLIQQPK